MPDAIWYALNAIYALWEVWSHEASLSAKAEEAAVSGDPDGETTAALICARGGNTHRQFVEFGERLGFGTQPFGASPFGVGGWYWQNFTDPNARFAQRSAWYRAHVQGREVLEPLEGACRWLAARPEIPRPSAQ
ncbi:hypothetical protein [Blastococcus sp. KM273128]|uniref:hypothetical protein n=1 Tax=Blastococcus sp. KM273128 TaxID=2570314 RepID=UPI001F484E64|nr:hypothetical protein [Blastococcus sp. KM273128]